MKRRAWRSATTFLQGYQGGRSSWGLALERAQRGCMFSTLDGKAEQVGVRRRKERQVYSKDTESITSFIQSYFAANQKYPAITLVVRETRGSRTTVKKLLDDLKCGQSSSVVGSDAAETLFHFTDSEDITSLDNLRIGQSASVIERDADEASLDCMDTKDMKSFDDLKIEQLASVAESDTGELGCLDTEDIKSLEDLDSCQLASVIGRDVGEADCLGREDKFNLTDILMEKGDQDASDVGEADCLGRKDIFNLTDILREKGNQGASDQDFLELLEQTNSKETAMKKTAPLIELLQQTASGSRRVHLSAWKGVEKDLSWDSTLLSIMPSSLNKKQKVISDDISSRTHSKSSEIGNTLSTFPEVGNILSSQNIETNSSTTRTSLLSTSTEITQDVRGTHKPQYGVKLVARIRKTVLNQFSSPKLIAKLKSISEVFSDILDKVDRIQVKDVPIHAIIYFKTEKRKLDALKLKTLVIDDEVLLLEGITGGAVEEKSPQDLGAASRPNETSIPDLPALEKSTSDISVESVIACKARLRSILDLQNTIVIEDYPMKVPLKSIHSFFSAFGALQIFYGKGSIFIKFKNEGDKEKALKVHQFVVDECCFRIKADNSSDDLVIRLESEQAEADIKNAMNACSEYGAIKYINYDKTGVLFAHYKTSEKGRAKDILHGLRQNNNLKGIWRAFLSLEGFKSCSRDIVDDEKSCSRNIVVDDIKRLLNLSTELSSQVEKLRNLSTELLNQVEKMNSDRCKDANHSGEF